MLSTCYRVKSNKKTFVLIMNNLIGIYNDKSRSSKCKHGCHCKPVQRVLKFEIRIAFGFKLFPIFKRRY